VTKRVMDYLRSLDACAGAVEWMGQQKTQAQAWADCQRGDWMLWLLGKHAGPPESEARKPLVLCACACSRLALKYVPKGEGRPRVAIETAERWARGKATIKEVRSAAAASYAAADAAAASYAAADASYAAADASYARTKSLAKCADIVRRHYPHAPRIPRGKP
jgi:hypothetical protein